MNPTCTTASLAETTPGYGLQGLNPRQYKAAAIYFKVLELAAVGGTDYRAVLNSTLISDAVTLVGRMDRNQRRIARMQILANNATASGASMPATVNALNALTKCCFQSYQDLDAIELLLDCKLGVHKSYPQ
jgi:hypothetical protein